MMVEEHSAHKRVDEILDKISKYGIFTMTNREREFMDAYSSGDKLNALDKLSILDRDIVFENSEFKFEICNTETYNHEVIHYGTMYVPEIILVDGSILDGNINGELVVYKNGTYILNFDKKIKVDNVEFVYDIYEFCEGLEYELDSFIDYIIQELS